MIFSISFLKKKKSIIFRRDWKKKKKFFLQVQEISIWRIFSCSPSEKSSLYHIWNFSKLFHLKDQKNFVQTEKLFWSQIFLFRKSQFPCLKIIADFVDSRRSKLFSLYIYEKISLVTKFAWRNFWIIWTLKESGSLQIISSLALESSQKTVILENIALRPK